MANFTFDGFDEFELLEPLGLHTVASLRTDNFEDLDAWEELAREEIRRVLADEARTAEVAPIVRQFLAALAREETSLNLSNAVSYALLSQMASRPMLNRVIILLPTLWT